MMRLSFPAITVAMMALLAWTPRSEAQGTLLGPLKAQWESTRDLVLNMAEIIPEDKYDYRPTPEVRSFREQLQHLAQENYMFMGMAAGERQDTGRIATLKSRAELLQALKESYQYGAKVWASITEQKAMEMITGRNNQQVPRWQPILLNIVDNMDHYGNLVVYVRLNGMTPPRTAARGQGQPSPQPSPR
jgi:uncharacterized damage-inducible protein DinB